MEDEYIRSFSVYYRNKLLDVEDFKSIRAQDEESAVEEFKQKYFEDEEEEYEILDVEMGFELNKRKIEEFLGGLETVED